MTKTTTRLYKASFDRAVRVEGAAYGGPTPFKATYLVTGEGEAFKRVIPGSAWDNLDVRLYDRLFDNSKSLPVKLTIAIPKGWDTVLILAIIVHYVRDNETLRFHSGSGRIRGVFEWFLQDATAVVDFVATQNVDVYHSIEASEDTHLS